MISGTLSVVLPAFNEADNIEAVVKRSSQVLEPLVPSFEIIIVNDGSADGTGRIIDRLSDEDDRVRAVHHERNQGYGSALRSGFDAATGDLIMFMDADRQFDMSDITALLPYVPDYDLVAGYRIRRNDALYRKLYARIFDIAVWVLFGVHMRDVDCAFKIYRGELVRAMPLTMPGALINTEMLAMARRMGASVVEVGVHHYPRTAGKSSGGSPRVVFRAMGETIRLWFRMRSIKLPEYRGRVPDEIGWSGISRTAVLGVGAAVASLALLAVSLFRRR
ncbi:MAG: glycosyltransferase family 2 protein [Thermomicrobiales bacterium]